MICIYKTTNLINGKIYVGKHESDDLYDSYLGSGYILGKAIKKYGTQNFSKVVLEVVGNDNWCEREKYWISVLDSRNPMIGYNITEGGGGDTISNHPHKDKILAKMSKHIKIALQKYWDSLTPEQKLHRCHDITGSNNPMHGKIGYWKDKPIPQCIIDKIKNTKKANGTYDISGNKNPNYDPNKLDKICKICGTAFRRTTTYCSMKCHIADLPVIRSGALNPFYNKRHSDVTKEKISKARKHGGYMGSQNIPFMINGTRYNSLGEASRKLSINPTTIWYRIKSSNAKFDGYNYIKEI